MFLPIVRRALVLSTAVALAAVLAPAAAYAQAQAAPAPAAGADALQDYDVRLREMETRVDDLKNRVFRSKQRLLLLSEKMQKGRTLDAKVVILHSNDIDGTFKLVEATYFLDGAEILREKERDPRDYSLNGKRDFQVYAGNITPGDHLLTVYMKYRGDVAGFTYVDAITISKNNSYTFRVDSGKQLTLHCRGYDRGRLIKFALRPDIKFDAPKEEEIGAE